MLPRVLTDRGRKNCGAPETSRIRVVPGGGKISITQHEAQNPPTNGIVERFHHTVLRNATGWHFRARSTQPSKSCNTISTSGSRHTLAQGIQWSVLTKDVDVTARRRCRRLSIVRRWRARRCSMVCRSAWRGGLPAPDSGSPATLNYVSSCAEAINVRTLNLTISPPARVSSPGT
jgi:hypothetical protein